MCILSEVTIFLYYNSIIMGYYALDATFKQSHTDTGESEHGVMNISRE